MFSGTAEPECPQRHCIILPEIVGAVGAAAEATPTPAAIPASADDAPDRGTTKDVTRATIHLVVNGATTAGRELSVTATPTSVGACDASDWANSIAGN